MQHPVSRAKEVTTANKHKTWESIIRIKSRLRKKREREKQKRRSK